LLIQNQSTGALGDGFIALGDGSIALGDGSIALGDGFIALGGGYGTLQWITTLFPAIQNTQGLWLRLQIRIRTYFCSRKTKALLLHFREMFLHVLIVVLKVLSYCI